ncbi:HigA family addiction module antitoxin [Plantactinospora sp. WMMB782]|uniref:HigA family addiction module antitoxin n=1 Tax=Plantactinospora sp. WMMB782 TaxID=3404121 RepID=UPI003B953865
MPPVHPGEVLMEEFIEPLGITQHRVAVAIGVPPRRINEIVHGKRRITADTALRLARYFGTSDLFWINLQNRFDLEIERDALGHVLEKIQPLRGLGPAGRAARTAAMVWAIGAVASPTSRYGSSGVSASGPPGLIDPSPSTSTSQEM